MYEDDTVLYVHEKKKSDVATKLTDQMQKVSDWLSQNCLTLNTDKTVATCFTRGKFLL